MGSKYDCLGKELNLETKVSRTESMEQIYKD